ncbi:biliverdin-producing heme oxygenase [Alteromonas sp. H39]|uniref:biliverdin-producing heme oxygenase n=1 Tax=Alteromonas sp. H39 TaxID=3389876 RepID=UPI0039DFB59A
MTSVLQQLRTHTAHQHQALEDTMPFAALMTDSFSASRYTDTLLTLRSFHGAIHQVTQEAPTHPVTSMLDASAVCGALDADLLVLNAPTAPEFVNNPPLTSQCTDIIACGYVWLGSSMGAKMIYRWLLSNGAASLPKNYYQTLSGCNQHWAGFRHYVDGLTLTEQEGEQICRSANALFSGLRNTASRLHTAMEPA